MSEKVTFDNGAKNYILEHWFVGEGVAVVEGQDLSIVRADGILQVVHAPMDGIFLAKRVADGESFKARESIGLILSHDEAGDLKVRDKLTNQDRRILDSLHSARKTASNLRQPVHIKATPSARRMARKEKIDLSEIPGSGPDGRIQLRDVRTYIKMEKTQKEEPSKTEVVYNLPLTPLAQHLVNQHGLDASKIPAPSGATRTRKSDVERYLKNPEKAAELIEQETEELYAKPLVDVLEETEKPAVKETEKPAVKETERPTVALDLSETLELEDSSEEKLLIKEPEEIKQSVIRLSTEKPVVIASDEPIELSGETETVKKPEMVRVEPKAAETRVLGERTVHLSAISVFDLKKIHLDQQTEESGIDYTSRVILTRIYGAISKNYPINLIGYVDDVSEREKHGLSVLEERIKISESPTGLKRGEFLIVDLLFDGLSEVSGLLNSEGRAVLYYSYLSQLADYIDNVDESKSLISLTLEFDTNILSPKRGLSLLRSVKRALEA